MFKRIAAITLVLVCTSVAWLILGGTIYYRTYTSNDRLKAGVVAVWGAPQMQEPPAASFERDEPVQTETVTDNRKTVHTEMRRTTYLLPLESSRVNVGLGLDYREKGLLWYSTYAVDFGGTYAFRNPSAAEELVTFRLKFPAEQAIYDGVVMEVNGRAIPLQSDQHGAFVSARLGPSEACNLRVAYRSQGLDSWRYKPGNDITQSSNFALTMRTNFKEIDFPANTLSPTEKHEIPGGWALTWRYTNLISGFQIGMTMPERLQPGPLAGEISYFAPVSLLLFFFVMFLFTTQQNIELHPMNYFFLATAFFSFHLLLAYLVDHVSIYAAFAISSLTSVFLLVSYLRAAVGWRFAVIKAGCAQLVYLVLFSYAFFLKGFTGLAVTIGCIVTLFVAMQMTARIRWAERFAPVRVSPPVAG